MRLLFDTHCLIWAIYRPERIGQHAQSVICAARTECLFSAASLVEIAIKRALDRSDFPFEPDEIRAAVLNAGYIEMPFDGRHAVALRHLPLLHRDPFDRLLIAQAQVEGATLLTADVTVRRYDIECLRA